MRLDSDLAYPVRPRPLPNESTQGYLKRVANANGFVSTRHLFSSLHTREQGAFDELCARLRLSIEDRALMFGTLPAHWAHKDIPLGLAISDFNQTHGRWCPLCLREGGVLLGQWTLKLVCTCPKHGIWLQEVCTRCGASLSWGDVVQSKGRCRCGASLLDAEVEKANGDAQALTLLLGGASSGAGRLECLSTMTTPAMHRLVRYLGPFQPATKPSHPGQTLDVHRLDVARGLVTGAAILLANWPSNLHTKISELQSDARESPSVRRTFDPLYRVLYDALPEPEFQFLRDAFEDYLHIHWWGLVCKRNRRLRPVTVEDHPRLSLPQVAKAARVPPSVVRHMVQAELVPSSSAELLSGRHTRSIHRSELPGIKSATDGALSLEKTAQVLALPKRRVRELIGGALLTPLVSRQFNTSAAAWLIPKSEVDRFHIQSGQAPSSSQNIAVRDILKYWRLRDQEVNALITAVVEGRLQAAGDGRSPVPIGKAILSASGAKEWLRRHRNETRHDFSVDAAAKVLGIKQQVAYDLVRLGLLRSTTVGTLGHRVSADDIEQFQTAYVSLASLASEGHRSPRALLCELAASPVCGPSIDGARQYFYRRSEINLQPCRGLV